MVNIINSTLGDYISLKVLYNFKPVIKPEVLSKIQAIMQDEFYELTELAEILNNHGIKTADYQYFSNFWLKDFGYKTHDVNYIIKEEYSSLKEIFFKNVLSEDILYYYEKDKKIRETTLILFIETLRQEYLVFQVGKRKLVNIRHLENQESQRKTSKLMFRLWRGLFRKPLFYLRKLTQREVLSKRSCIRKTGKDEFDKELMINFIRNIPGIKRRPKVISSGFQRNNRPSVIS